MTNRFRDMSDKQLIGLYLLIEALAKGKKAVHLASGTLQYLTRVERVHTPRVKDLALSFAPFLVGYKIHDVPGPITNRHIFSSRLIWRNRFLEG